jgi:hypothetical protein
VRTVVLLLIAAGCGGAPRAGGGGGGGDDTSCEPGRCLEDFARAIEADRAQARTCFDANVAPATTDGGRVVINFEVGPDGAVVDASQAMRDGQITDPAVVDCIINVVKGVTFTASPAGKTTRAFHTFDFAPRRSAKP